MASPPELSLDCKPHSYSLLLKSIGEQQATDQTLKLEEFLAHLEEERLKIDAFKRELPLCMQLLNNAMEASRQQLQSYRANQGPRPILEEFIPLKQPTSELSSDIKASSNVSDMANWMTSAQLCSQTTDIGAKQQLQQTISSFPNKETEIGFSVSTKLGLETKQRINGGAFHPFSKERNSLPELALVSVDKEIEDKKCLEIGNGVDCLRRENNCGMVEQGQGGNVQQESQTTAGGGGGGGAGGGAGGQGHRKARRCWSPDLHRRFVNALQMLGGSQVATPKQIRELMKVDGLTNDEVKSHLQKYRLHTRRPSPSPQAAGAQAPQLVVLGGIWVPPEYAAAAHGGAPHTLYGAHPSTHASAHYCAPQVPQEFYPAPQVPQLHHHTLHQQLHMYHQTSPESDVRGGGDRSESMEDGKSDSGGSWKAGESGGENGGGERKGEESNGSDITLKF